MKDILAMIKHTSTWKLLYVEDNELARTSTLGILNEFFADIVVAVDGEDGFEKFKENSIDLIITDINMPRLNGLDMLKKIRKIDKEVVAIVFSAHNETKYLDDSKELNVLDYVLKPISMEQFIEVLATAVDKMKD